MKYYIDTTLSSRFDETVEKVKSILPDYGFGVVSEFRIDEKIKGKLGIDFRPYHVIGACNPKYAYEALQIEPLIGTMLPCNIIVQKTGENETMVAAIDPVASMLAVENPKLNEAAQTIKDLLAKLINGLK